MTRAASPRRSATPGAAVDGTAGNRSGGPLSFYIPTFPIRLSDCHNNVGRRRIDSAKYRAYKSFVYPHLRFVQNGFLNELICTPVEVWYTVKRPDNRKRDLSNLLKCLDDTLVGAGVLADDSLIYRLIIEWGQPNIGEVSVTVLTL